MIRRCHTQGPGGYLHRDPLAVPTLQSPGEPPTPPKAQRSPAGGQQPPHPTFTQTLTAGTARLQPTLPFGQSGR